MTDDTTTGSSAPEPDDDERDAEDIANAELPLDATGPTELGGAVDD